MDSMKHYATQITHAVRFSGGTLRRAIATLVIAAATFVLLMLTSFPGYSWQMLNRSVFYLDEVISMHVWGLQQSSGTIGLVLAISYAVLTGIALVNMSTLVQVNGLRSMVSGTGSLTPALLVGGCASCGAGLLGLLGFVGAGALLPFHGNGIRFAGILLVLGFLASTGNPRTCNI